MRIIRFEKRVPRKMRELLEQQMKEYRKEMSMSKEEARALSQWVAEGHSPYDNDCMICSDWGLPLDFVSARRLMMEYEKRRQSLAEKGKEISPGEICPVYDTAGGDLYYRVSDFMSDEEETPFH